MKLYLFLIISILLGACSRDPYNPSRYLSSREQADIILKTIHYSAKIPPHSTQATKFDHKFDGYYTNSANQCEVLYYYPSDSKNFFLIARVARSITPMKEGIGGVMKFDQAGKLIYYNEIFRTWKMPEDTLKLRAKFLFDRMIKGKDLTMYYSKYQGDRYIEFPDERFVFDPQKRLWIDTVLDSVYLLPN